MKHDPVLGLELVLTHYQSRLKDHISEDVKHQYEGMYLENYHELYYLNKDRAKPFMEWWVRYARW